MDLSPETLDAIVPNMLLQPLVENSRSPWDRPSRRSRHDIRSIKEGELLQILLRDDGPGRTSTQPGTAHFGVGLNNTRTRLQQMYGNEQSLTIRQPETVDSKFKS